MNENLKRLAYATLSKPHLCVTSVKREVAPETASYPVSENARLQKMATVVTYGNPRLQQLQDDVM